MSLADFVTRVFIDVRVLEQAAPEDLTQEVQDCLANFTGDVVEALARHPAASLETLERLAVHNSKHVRRSVATNVNAPLGLLRVLASDSAWEVRWGLVMRSGSLAPEVQDILAMAADLDERTEKLLLQRKDFEWRETTPASFYWRSHPAIYQTLQENLQRPDRVEAALALLPSWQGTFGSLLESARLVTA